MNDILPKNARAVGRRRKQQDTANQGKKKEIDPSTRAKIEHSIRKVDDPDAQEALNLLLDAVDG